LRRGRLPTVGLGNSEANRARAASPKVAAAQAHGGRRKLANPVCWQDVSGASPGSGSPLAPTLAPTLAPALAPALPQLSGSGGQSSRSAMAALWLANHVHPKAWHAPGG